MGIEPTLAAWEAAVLPLNYARMTPRPRTCSCPRRARTAPEGSGGFRTRLATGHLAEVGSLSGRGHRFSPSIRPVTGRRSLSPRSSTRYGIAKPCGLSSPRLPDAVTGLPCSALTTGTGRVPPFHRWRFCQRVLTKQQDNRPRPVWVGPISRFGPSSFTVFISGSLSLTLRSSLAPHRLRLPISRCAPHGGQRTRMGGCIVSALST